MFIQLINARQIYFFPWGGGEVWSQVLKNTARNVVLLMEKFFLQKWKIFGKSNVKRYILPKQDMYT